MKKDQSTSCLFPSVLSFTCSLVCLSCHNKITQTEWLKQQLFIFSQLQRLGGPRSKCWLIWFSPGESSFPGLPALFLCLHMAERESKLPGVSSYKDTTVIMVSANLVTSQKPHLQIPSHCRVRASTYMSFGRTTHSVHKNFYFTFSLCQ